MKTRPKPSIVEPGQSAYRARGDSDLATLSERATCRCGSSGWWMLAAHPDFSNVVWHFGCDDAMPEDGHTPVRRRAR